MPSRAAWKWRCATSAAPCSTTDRMGVKTAARACELTCYRQTSPNTQPPSSSPTPAAMAPKAEKKPAAKKVAKQSEGGKKGGKKSKSSTETYKVLCHPLCDRMSHVSLASAALKQQFNCQQHCTQEQAHAPTVVQQCN